LLTTKAQTATRALQQECMRRNKCVCKCYIVAGFAESLIVI